MAPSCLGMYESHSQRFNLHDWSQYRCTLDHAWCHVRIHPEDSASTIGSHNIDPRISTSMKNLRNERGAVLVFELILLADVIGVVGLALYQANQSRNFVGNPAK